MLLKKKLPLVVAGVPGIRQRSAAVATFSTEVRARTEDERASDEMALLIVDLHGYPAGYFKLLDQLNQDELVRSVKMAALGALVLRNLERAAELVQGFKQLAVGMQSARRQGVRLADLVAAVCAEVGGEHGRPEILLEQRVPPELELDSYPGPLNQVLVNLLVNAYVHAFGPSQLGRITVEAEALPGDQLACACATTATACGPSTCRASSTPSSRPNSTPADRAWACTSRSIW